MEAKTAARLDENTVLKIVRSALNQDDWAALYDATTAKERTELLDLLLTDASLHTDFFGDTERLEYLARRVKMQIQSRPEGERFEEMMFFLKELAEQMLTVLPR